VRSSFEQAHFFHIVVLLMPSRPLSFSATQMLRDCCAVVAARRQIQNRDREPIAENVSG
jgi:hypothetical protein